MQVGDAPGGVDHRQGRAAGVHRIDIRRDFRPFFRRQGLDFGQKFGHAVVRIHGQLRQFGPVLGKHFLIIDGNAMAENNGIRHPHHGGFQVEGEQHIVGLGLGHLVRVELAQGADIHHGAVDNFPGLQGNAGFKRGDSPVGGYEFDGGGAGLRSGDRLLAAKEILPGHVTDPGFRDRGPVPHHPMGIPFAMLFDGRGGAAVGVSLPDDRVDRAAQHPGIAGLNLTLGVRGRFVRVVGNGVALALQFGDGRFQLGNRGADVGQLDQVGRRLQAQIAAHPQIVGDLLRRGQLVGEVSQHPPGQGDVPGFQGDARAFGESLEDGQQGVRGQGRRLIGFGVNNLGRFRHTNRS